MKLKRYEGDPVIEPRGDDWEAVATFNCAAICKDGVIHVLYRAVGDYVHYASHLGYAIFDKGMNLLERPEEPVFDPGTKLWEMSIEGPRFKRLGAIAPYDVDERHVTLFPEHISAKRPALDLS